MKKNYVYDLETYPNLFCGVFNCNNHETVFEISGRRNDYEKMFNFYQPENIGFAIGFNNVKFDAQIMQYLISNYKTFRFKQGSELVKLIFSFAQSVIQKANNNEFMPFAEWHIKVPQIDLYLMNHYNNQNKRTSLKWIEFSINYHKVQDLPYKFDRNLKPEQFDEVIAYCKNDVKATRQFAEECKDLIKLRIAQDKQYPELRLRNKADSSVGETLFLKFMSDEMGVEMKELRKLRTVRTTLEVKDLLLPYINFKTPELQKALDYFKESTYGVMGYNAKGEYKRKVLETTVKYGGIEYEFGEGGLHASWQDKIFEADEDYHIIDWDVESYYPNLAIKNGFRPEHLGDMFSIVYNNIFVERKKFPKGTTENKSLKIILNGSYGKLKEETSFLFDAKPALQICINGQLLLAMLCERFSLIEGCTVIQANTDGVTIKIHKSKLDDMMNIVTKWQKLTQLTLERADYSKMVISNVNNYMAKDTKGKIKYKGLYEIDPEFHKNKSQRVVRIALQQYFFENVPIVDTITNHINNKEGYDWNEEKKKYNIKSTGIYDYCHGRKVQWNQQFVIIKGVNEEKINQKVIRYYNTTEKTTMMKKYSDGRVEAVNKGYRAKLFQEFKEEKDYNIDFNYYVNECYKITTPFEGGNPKIGKQLSLFE